MDAKAIVVGVLLAALLSIPFAVMAHGFGNAADNEPSEPAPGPAMMGQFSGMGMMGGFMAQHHAEMSELMERFENGRITAEEFAQAMIEEMREMPCHR